MSGPLITALARAIARIHRFAAAVGLPGPLVSGGSVACYLRHGVVYIPTFGRELSGVRRMVNPVAAVPVTDAEALHRAIKKAFLRGEPPLPSLDPKRRQAALPPLPRLAGMRSWSDFYAGVAIWQIHAQDGAYRITPKLLDTVSGRWVPDIANAIVLPLGTGLDATCGRAVEIFAAAARKRRPPQVICYLRQGIVYVPTLCRAPNGVSGLTNPIAAVPLEKIDVLRAVLQERFLLGNPTLEIGSSLLDEEGRALLALAGAENWAAFNRSSTGAWNIANRDDAPEIVPFRLYSKKGGWVPDRDAAISLPAGMTLDAACDRLIEIMQAAVPPESGILEPRIPSAVETLQTTPEAEPYVVLPSDPDRVDELADFLEWIANAEPTDAPVIRNEIKRYYYDHGDTEGGDALHRALEEALLATDLVERARILDRFERYVQEDWVTANWTKKEV